MKISTFNDIRAGSRQVSVEVFEKEIYGALSGDALMYSIRSNIAEKITDMIWEKMQPAILQSLKELDNG